MDAGEAVHGDGTGAAGEVAAAERRRGGNVLPLVMVTVLAAVGIGGGVWGLTATPSGAEEDAWPPEPVTCAAPRPEDHPAYPALCAALNRADLPTLLGSPADRVISARPGGFTGTPVVEVRLGDTGVLLTDSADPVGETEFRKRYRAEPEPLLGHAAATYSDRMLGVMVVPGQESAATDSRPSRHLVVEQRPGVPGGRTYEIALFRRDGWSPDDEVLRRLAEAVLPTLPGWSA
ncbi:DUF6215 domain-containing protein [Kitasatospora sp. NPDC096147]|uniref:DUF6215 domain-containing protein n=1 Tax=Kitasatospora sp. NPDC096147 TaxID=3364093 RepID=UPI00381413B0